jgi:eukaryotic-like serine/threonine-protein kinase
MEGQLATRFPYQIAEIHTFRGEASQGFEWLERAYRDHDPGLNQLKSDPLWPEFAPTGDTTPS